jgi:hypothetical protein
VGNSAQADIRYLIDEKVYFVGLLSVKRGWMGGWSGVASWISEAEAIDW